MFYKIAQLSHLARVTLVSQLSSVNFCIVYRFMLKTFIFLYLAFPLDSRALILELDQNFPIPVTLSEPGCWSHIKPG